MAFVAAPHQRRTQAERSATTREKVILAATECIAESGFAAATMSRIAERAGVTWGAMQHQFGDKEAIIDAVIARSVDEFAQQMQGLRTAEPELAPRIHAFTERAWSLFERPSYRAILDILLHRREKTQGIAEVFTPLWLEIFADLGVNPARQLAAQRFAFVMLSGMATESVLLPGAYEAASHFEVLEDTLLRLLSARGAGSAATSEESEQAAAASLGPKTKTPGKKRAPAGGKSEPTTKTPGRKRAPAAQTSGPKAKARGRARTPSVNPH